MICTLCKTHVLRHGTLCSTCTTNTLGHLHRLPRMWAALETWLAPGTTGAAQYGGRVRHPEAPLPLDTEVLTLRAAGGITGVLEDWADAVRHTRGLPERPRVGSLAHRVTAAAGYLASQIHFIALWEQGPQLGREIGQLVDRARNAVQRDEAEEKGRPTFLGYCIAVDPSGVICGARIPAAIDRPVQCAWCLCPYPPETWLQLRHLQPGRREFTEEQVAA
ncbi:hypothetical protein [Streptomyces fructofermentans]|uniref:Uncharacterized protein n=1 Tax=Streptomyces fructofermentans TaxID=152141 RepID=A0A918NVC2_9ACTN|nr:hypothetical protein [Streptomyces fructofermentans]GGX99142.1 hypothetical protein GCM10010515_76650 [Streptomyces fructofermentans]